MLKIIGSVSIEVHSFAGCICSFEHQAEKTAHNKNSNSERLCHSISLSFNSFCCEECLHAKIFSSCCTELCICDEFVNPFYPKQCACSEFSFCPHMVWLIPANFSLPTEPEYSWSEAASPNCSLQFDRSLGHFQTHVKIICMCLCSLSRDFVKGFCRIRIVEFSVPCFQRGLEARFLFMLD